MWYSCKYSPAKLSCVGYVSNRQIARLVMMELGCSIIFAQSSQILMELDSPGWFFHHAIFFSYRECVSTMMMETLILHGRRFDDLMCGRRTGSWFWRRCWEVILSSFVLLCFNNASWNLHCINFYLTIQGKDNTITSTTTTWQILTPSTWLHNWLIKSFACFFIHFQNNGYFLMHISRLLTMRTFSAYALHNNWFRSTQKPGG